MCCFLSRLNHCLTDAYYADPRCGSNASGLIFVNFVSYPSATLPVIFSYTPCQQSHTFLATSHIYSLRSLT